MPTEVEIYGPNGLAQQEREKRKPNLTPEDREKPYTIPSSNASFTRVIRKSIRATTIFLCLLASAAFGQSQAVVKVELFDANKKLIQYGSGVVVADLGPSAKYAGWYDNHVATCSHVVAAANVKNIQVEYRTGEKVRFAAVVADDPENDIAILKAIGPSKAKSVAALGQFIVGRNYRHDGWKTRGDCRASLRNHGREFFDGRCEVGDSGGAVFDDAGKLVGIMQGGWLWLEDPKVTWPIRTAGRELIESAIRSVK